MFKVRLLGAPKAETAADKKKREEKEAKAKKDGKEVRTRGPRANVLVAFDVDTESAAEVTKVVANTIAKQSTESQKAVRAIQVQRVVAGVDPTAVTW